MTSRMCGVRRPLVLLLGMWVRGEVQREDTCPRPRSTELSELMSLLVYSWGVE